MFFVRCLPLLLTGCLVLACTDRPEGVAERYWKAVASGDVEEAEGLSSSTSARRLERLVAGKPLTGVEVGMPVVDGDQAEVETRLVRAGAPLVFVTTLKRVDGDWRVDGAESTQAFRQAIVEASMAELSEVLRDGADVVGEVVEEGLEQATDAMREALEQLERGSQRPR